MHWSQLQTMLWLRWRLTRNQWSRSGRLSVGISIAVTVILLVIGLGGGVGGLVVGVVFGLEEVSPTMLLVMYDVLAVAFLFFWMIGILSTIQRSESIDIGKILHLPVSLRGVFVLNYLASHVTPSIVVFAPWMTGMALGLALGRDWTMVAMIPLTFGFLFMLTAWTYYLRGWLVTLMRNPRRYRAVVAGTTMALVLLSQLPNLLMNTGFLRESPSLSEMRRARSDPAADGAAERHALSPTVLLWHKLAPPLWVGHGAMSLAVGNPLPAILATTATFGLGGLGLAFAYRSTCRFYGGRTTEKKIREGRKKRTRTAAGGTLLERKLPGISEEAAAMAFASCRSLTRASEVKMILASDVMMLFVFGGTILFSDSHERSLAIQFFYGTGAALLPFLGLIQLMANQFGFDRAGFRTLVLSPAPRSQILLGKNLGILPITALLGVIYLALASLGLRIGPLILLAALVQLAAAFFLVCIMGNLLSSLLPYRVREGTMAGTKVTPTRVLLNLLSHLACMAVLSVLLLPAVLASLLAARSGLTAELVNLVLSVVELAIIGTIYGLSLFGLGELLQRREREILRIVTQEVE